METDAHSHKGRVAKLKYLNGTRHTLHNEKEDHTNKCYEFFKITIALSKFAIRSFSDGGVPSGCICQRR